jgi:hypothetical protein
VNIFNERSKRFEFNFEFWPVYSFAINREGELH